MDDFHTTLLAEFEPLVSGENAVWLMKARLEESDLTGRPQNLMKDEGFISSAEGTR